MIYLNNIRLQAPTRPWRIAYTCLALRALGIIGPGLAGVATMRLFEATVCRTYYRQTDPSAIDLNDMVPEIKCKVAQVQSQMANLSGVNGAISLVPALVGALPYLIWSRLVNQRLLLLVYYVGSLSGLGSYLAILYFHDNFDIRLIWFTNVFSLIGGGPIIFRSLVSSIAAEALPPESLTVYYLYSSATLLIAFVLSSAIGLELMKSSLWSAVALGFGLQLLSIPVLSFLDDTSNDKYDPDAALNLSSLAPPSLQPDDDDDDDGDGDDNNPSNPRRSFWTEAFEIRKQGRKLIQTANHIRCYMLIFLVHKCGRSIGVLIPQWLSKRLSEPLRTIGFIELGEQLWITVLLLLTPRVQRYITRSRRGRNISSSGANARAKDDAASLRLVRWSVCFSVTGTLLLSVSWSVPTAVLALSVSAAGAGFYDMLLGYVTTTKIVDRPDVVQVYMCLSIVEDLTGRVATTGLEAVYALTVRMDNWVGMALPLWLCAAFYAGALLLVRRL